MSMKVSNLLRYVLPVWVDAGAKIYTTPPHSPGGRYYLVRLGDKYYTYEVRSGNVLLPIKHQQKEYHIKKILETARDITEDIRVVKSPDDEREEGKVDGWTDQQPLEG